MNSNRNLWLSVNFIFKWHDPGNCWIHKCILHKCKSYYVAQRTETIVTAEERRKRCPNANWNNQVREKEKLTCNNVDLEQITPQIIQDQRMCKNDKFWHNFNTKLGLILLAWRREQRNRGRETGGKWTQRYRRRENRVREAGGHDPAAPPPPPPPRHN